MKFLRKPRTLFDFSRYVRIVSIGQSTIDSFNQHSINYINIYFIFGLYLFFCLTISRMMIDILFVTWTTIKLTDFLPLYVCIYSTYVCSSSFFILSRNWWIQLLTITTLDDRDWLHPRESRTTNARAPRHDDTRRFVDNILLFHLAEYTRFRTIKTRNAGS